MDKVPLVYGVPMFNNKYAAECYYKCVPIRPLCEFLAQYMVPRDFFPKNLEAHTKEELIVGWECVISEFLKWEANQNG